MIGYGFFSYESRLERYLEREVRKASGMHWFDADPGTLNSLLFGAGFTYGQVFSRFRWDAARHRLPPCRGYRPPCCGRGCRGRDAVH